MKIRRNIYLVLGILFVVLDLLSTILQWEEIKSALGQSAYGAGYLMGSQFLLCIGLAFLYSSRRLQKKIERKEQRALEDTFLASDER